MWRSDGKPQAHPTFSLLAQNVYTAQRLREQMSFFVQRPRGADGMTAQHLVDLLDDPESDEAKKFIGSLLAGTCVSRVLSVERPVLVVVVRCVCVRGGGVTFTHCVCVRLAFPCSCFVVQVLRR
jgi:hypothetical protein